jgi:uncharacterized protein (TIGR02145 family)
MIAPFNIINKEGKGIQLGLVNSANSFKGVQLGLINRIKENKIPFKVLPIININFKRSPMDVPKAITLDKPKDNSFQLELIADSMIDERNGRVYKTITINKVTWMAENLNIVNSSIDGICYENNDANCKSYGVLYWAEMALKVCPIGWHLPSKLEFDTLITTFGTDEDKAYKALVKGGVSQFNGLLGGYFTSSKKYRIPRFDKIESRGFYWSSTRPLYRTNDLYGGSRGSFESSDKLYILMFSDDRSVKINWGRLYKDAYSVRCIKD